MHVRSGPFGKLLRPARFGVCVAAGTQHADKYLCRSLFAARSIDHRYGLAGIIDEDFLACLVFLPQHQVEPSSPPTVMIAELTVLQPAGIRFLVLDPEQLQGDTGTAFCLQFPMHSPERVNDNETLQFLNLV